MILYVSEDSELPLRGLTKINILIVLDLIFFYFIEMVRKNLINLVKKLLNIFVFSDSTITR